MQKLVLSKYGNVDWISRIYKLPLELSEWNGHFLTDRNSAWQVYDGSESIVSRNHAFLLHQLDLGNIIFLRRIKDQMSLYGNRRFSLDFFIKIVSGDNLEEIYVVNFA